MNKSPESLTYQDVANEFHKAAQNRGMTEAGKNFNPAGIAEALNLPDLGKDKGHSIS